MLVTKRAKRRRLFAQVLTPITTTSYFSLAPVWVPVRGVSLGRGAARDGRILKSRAELAFSWNTGIVKIAEEEE